MLNSKYKIIAFICCAFVCAFLGLGLSKDSVLASSSSIPFGQFVSSGSAISVGSFNGVDTIFTFSVDGYISFDSVTSSFYFVRSSRNGNYYYNFNSTPSAGILTTYTYANGYYISSFFDSGYLHTNIRVPIFNSSEHSNITDFLTTGGVPEPSLDDNLGFLDVYKTRRRNLTTTTGNPHVYNREYLYFWNSKSSTGFNVSASGVNVDSRFEVEYTSKSQNNTVKFLSNISSVSGSVGQGLFDTNDMYSYATNVLDFYNSDSVFSRGSIGLNFFVRISDTNTNTFGPWLRIEWSINESDFIDGKNPSSQETGHFDENDNWIPDPDSDLPDIDNTDGSGGTPEEADDNANKNENNTNITIPSPDDFGDIDFSDIVTGIKGALSSFTSTVTSFISLVSATLSFLPKWVLNFFALSIAIWCIMLVKRAIF